VLPPPPGLAAGSSPAPPRTGGGLWVLGWILGPEREERKSEKGGRDASCLVGGVLVFVTTIYRSHLHKITVDSNLNIALDD
jgi:hypothetical protein